MTNIKDYKELKRLELLLKDVETLVKTMNVTTKSLKQYQKYTPVKRLMPYLLECEIDLEMNLTILRDRVKKHGKLENPKK